MKQMKQIFWRKKICVKLMNQVYFLSIYIMDSKSVEKNHEKTEIMWNEFLININRLTGFSAAFVTYLMILWWKILREEFRDHLELELRIRGTGGMNGKQVVWVITRNLEPYQIVISSFPHGVILSFDLTLRTVTKTKHYNIFYNIIIYIVLYLNNIL